MSPRRLGLPCIALAVCGIAVACTPRRRPEAGVGADSTIVAVGREGTTVDRVTTAIIGFLTVATGDPPGGHGVPTTMIQLVGDSGHVVRLLPDSTNASALADAKLLSQGRVKATGFFASNDSLTFLVIRLEPSIENPP